MSTRPISYQVAVALLLTLTSADARAYLDPNAGGLLYQILLPIVVALTAGWRYIRIACINMWQRLTCRRKSPESERPRAALEGKADTDDGDSEH